MTSASKNLRRTFLKAARLIKRGWCREWSARRAGGTICDVDSKQAVSWCLHGAICRVEGDNGPASNLLYDAGYSPDWNDSQQSRTPVLAVLYEFAEACR